MNDVRDSGYLRIRVIIVDRILVMDSLAVRAWHSTLFLCFKSEKSVLDCSPAPRRARRARARSLGTK